VPQATAWVRGDTVTVVVAFTLRTGRIPPEVVEVLGVEDTDVVAELAPVVRISGVPRCLGSFRAGM
jgi:hypothetical protein